MRIWPSDAELAESLDAWWHALFHSFPPNRAPPPDVQQVMDAIEAMAKNLPQVDCDGKAKQ